MTTTNHQQLHTTLNKHRFCGSPRDPLSQAEAAEHYRYSCRGRTAPTVAQRGARKEPPRGNRFVYSLGTYQDRRTGRSKVEEQEALTDSTQCVPRRLSTPWGHIKRLASNLWTLTSFHTPHKPLVSPIVK